MNQAAFFETISQLPLALISLIGLGVLILRWKSMGEFAATLMLCALVSNLLAYGGSLWIAHWFHSQLGEHSLSELARTRALLSIPVLVLAAAAWGSLVAAALVGRSSFVGANTRQ